MQIGIISNADSILPLLYALAGQKDLQVHFFYSPGDDAYLNEKIRVLAKQAGVVLSEEKKAGDIYDWLSKGKFNLCFMQGYKSLLDVKKLSSYKDRLFNIHFGPLPAFRGPVPVFWQLKNGETHLGLSIHHVTERFDAGAVVWQKKIENQPWYNYELANQVLGQVCVEGVFALIRIKMLGIPLPVYDTTQEKARYQKRPQQADVLIDWKNMNAVTICNLIRACNPWNKGAISYVQGREIKLLDAYPLSEIPDNAVNLVAGSVYLHQDALYLSCANAEVIAVTMLYYNNMFIPARQSQYIGISSGMRFG